MSRSKSRAPKSERVKRLKRNLQFHDRTFAFLMGALRKSPGVTDVQEERDEIISLYRNGQLFHIEIVQVPEVNCHETRWGAKMTIYRVLANEERRYVMQITAEDVHHERVPEVLLEWIPC